MKRMALGIVFGLLLAAACAAVTNTDSADGTATGRCVEMAVNGMVDTLKVLVYDGECRARARPEEGDHLWAVPAPISRCDIRVRFHTERTQMGVQRGRCGLGDSRTPEPPEPPP